MLSSDLPICGVDGDIESNGPRTFLQSDYIVAGDDPTFVELFLGLKLVDRTEEFKSESENYLNKSKPIDFHIVKCGMRMF